MDKKAHVQGLALYLEYEKPYDTGFAVQQVLLTPDGYNSEGVLVQTHLYRRRMKPGEGKKQWKVTATNEKIVADALSGEVAELDFMTWGQKAFMRLDYANPLFDAIVIQHWTLRLKPLVMEVSQVDLDDIAKGKTPYKLMYRMQQCRLKAGFPADAVPAA
jgi:hypothetical protein